MGLERMNRSTPKISNAPISRTFADAKIIYYPGERGMLGIFGRYRKSRIQKNTLNKDNPTDKKHLPEVVES